jgi:predicted DNA-binding protein
MKTMAIRLEDEIAEMLGLVASLEGTSQIEQIREAVLNHLSRKMADGELAGMAEAALEDIDRQASARKEALSTLLAGAATSEESPPKSTGGRRRSTTKPKPGDAPVIPMGFAPPGRGGRRSGK